MLTKAEKNFLNNPRGVTPDYAAVLKSRLNLKIRKIPGVVSLIKNDLDLIVAKSRVIGLDIGPLEALSELHLDLQNPVISKSVEKDDSLSAISILDQNTFA